MKYDRFEQLPVWQAAMDFADRVYSLTNDRWFRQPGDLADQLRRAALSVSNNIAEGFERGSTAELLQFLYYARGSAGESRSMLHFLSRRWASLSSEQVHMAGSSGSVVARPRTTERSSAGAGSNAVTRPNAVRRPNAVTRPNAAAGSTGVLTQPPPPDASVSRAAQAQTASPVASGRTSAISETVRAVGTVGYDPHSEISNLKSEAVALTALAESCSRQIRAWTDSLQNTDIPGQRHLNDKTRSQYEARRRSSEFMRQVDEVVRQRLGTTAALPDAAPAASSDSAGAVSPDATD